MTVVETDVEIATPDGTCDAAFLHPEAGSHPGVLFWADAGGLRPVMRAMGKRLAAEGYAVLVPNPFYRLVKGSPFADASTLNFQDPADLAKIHALIGSVTPPGYAEKDAIAYIAFLDAQPAVDRAKKIGTQGYCMGGALALRTAATVPDRVGAVAPFHAGGLVTDQPTSPHLLAPRIHAQLYFGIARNDDERQPDAKDKLKEAFPNAEIEVYPAFHGWCIADMPKQNGTPLYDEAQAERAWGKLLALYKIAL
jgi:carboxymethylenebutenolidase